jgi:hypothetical protein
MTSPRTRPPALPRHWTPAQALAVFEMIELMRDELWLAYAADIQRALRRDQQPVDPRQLLIPLDPDQPF